MSKEDICREDTQIDFKGTFQSNNNFKKNLKKHCMTTQVPKV